MLPDFEIKPGGCMSDKFLSMQMYTFQLAAGFLKELPYGRNTNKNDLGTVFAEGKGTCSTKHAILKELADENFYEGITLMLGIFRMNGTNTPPVAETLKTNGLEYVPEAHVYLRYQNQVLDFTHSGASPDFISDLLIETEIMPGEIGQAKIDLHKKYLARWLAETKELDRFTPEDLWEIREQCIADLSNRPAL